MKLRNCGWLLASVGVLGGAGFSSSPAPRTPAAVVERAIPLLQQSAQTWTDKSSCVSCHHQGLGMMAVSAGREAGFLIKEGKAAEQVQKTSAKLELRMPALRIGARAFNSHFSAGIFLSGFAAEGMEPNRVTDGYIDLLMRRQGVDGGWISDAYRPPLESSNVSATAYAIRGLATYGPRSGFEGVGERIALGRKWLLNQPLGDKEDVSMTIMGVLWSGGSRGSVSSRVQALLARQDPNGGWAQLPTREPDAYATGQALVALQMAGHSGEDLAVRKGIEFLTLTQDENGAWRVPSRRRFGGLPYFESGYPFGEDQFISYAGGAWATMALVMSLTGEVPDAVRPGLVIERGRGSDWVFSEKRADDRLARALVNGSVADVRRTLDAGGDVRADYGMAVRPVHLAAHDLEKLKLLVNRGARVHDLTEGGWSVVRLAGQSHEGAAAFRWLLERGVTVEADEDFMLSVTSSGDVGRVEDLAKAGAFDDPEVMERAILGSMFGRNLAAVRLLLERQGRFEGDGAGAVLVEHAVVENMPEVLELLIAGGADVTSVTEQEGKTPLHIAAEMNFGHDRIVRALLAAGADREAVDEGGRRPVDLAREVGNLSVIRLLAVERSGGKISGGED